MNPLKYIALFLCFFGGLRANIGFPLDLKVWKPAFHNETETMCIIEYTLTNETTETWSDLFTVHNFWGPEHQNLSPERIYNQFIGSLGQTNRIKYRILEKSKNSLLFEWWLTGSEFEHEWARILTDNFGYYLLRYTTKNASDFKEKGKIWVQDLRKAHFAPNFDRNLPIQKAAIEGVMFTDKLNTFSIMQPTNWKHMLSTSSDHTFHVFVAEERKGNLVLPLQMSNTNALKFLEAYKLMNYEKGGKLLNTLTIERINKSTLVGEVIGPTPVEVGDFQINHLFVMIPGKKVAQVLIFSAKVEHFDELVPFFKEMARSYQGVGF